MATTDDGTVSTPDEGARRGPGRSVTASADLGIGRAGQGFVQGTIGADGRLPLDPFLSITEFWMSEPVFAPHPHAGFSAVTYMFGDSEGAFVNRDSLGDRSRIGPGSLHWTQAGSGMLHEEIPERPGLVSHGVQLFVNLRAADKGLDPRAFHLDGVDVPIVAPVEGAEVRVVLGRWGAVRSPLDGLAEPIGLFDVTLAPMTAIDHDGEPDDRVVLLVVDGEVSIGGTTIGAHHVAVLDGPARRTELQAGDAGASLLLLVGRPMGEPVVFGGSFVAVDRRGIVELDGRFRRGEMGELAPSF